MQCKTVTALPANEKWTFEIKFDGYRCIALKRGSAVTLFFLATRKCLTNASQRSSTRDFVLDGKLVAFDPHAADDRIAAVPLPNADPVHGLNGPLVELWGEVRSCREN